MLPEQEAELYRIWPDAEVIQYPERCTAEQIAEMATHYDEVILVAPLSIIRKLTKMGIKPIVSHTVKTPDGRVVHDGFYRVLDVKIHTRRVSQNEIRSPKASEQRAARRD
jgi:hypothetical protein